MVEQTVSILFMCLDTICTIFHGLWFPVPLENPIFHTSVAILHHDLTCHLVLALLVHLAPHLETLLRRPLVVQGWTVPALLERNRQKNIPE